MITYQNPSRNLGPRSVLPWLRRRPDRHPRQHLLSPLGVRLPDPAIRGLFSGAPGGRTVVRFLSYFRRETQRNKLLRINLPAKRA